RHTHESADRRGNAYQYPTARPVTQPLQRNGKRHIMLRFRDLRGIYEHGRALRHEPRSPVLIVGGGPAGATAGRTLARAGVPVRILDRSVFPRNKPCGGGISVRVLRRFPYLDPELRRIATHSVSRLYLEGPDGGSTVVRSDLPAALLIRRV